MAKVQGCFGDFVQGLFKSLPALPSKVLAELRFYRDNLLFNTVKRRVDVASPEQLGKKKRIEVTAGTLPTHGPLFVAMLVGTVVLVGALTYIPALALGPVVEHLQLHAIH